MPGFVYDADKVADLAVAVLARDLVLPQTVTRVPGVEYRGSGGSVKLRVPQRRTAKARGSAGDPIDYVGIDETPVTLSVEHFYDATALTDEDATLVLIDFARQILGPMTAGLAELAEGSLATVMNGVTPNFGWTDAADPEKVDIDILEARRQLVANDVPAVGRFLVVSPSIAAVCFQLDKFVRADASGSDTALRDATLGRIYGLNVVESNGIEDGTALVFQQSGFVFASLAPANPQGAAQSAAASDSGISLRVLFDFDPGVLSDVCVLSTFAGAAVVDVDRIVRIADESS